VCGIRKGDGPSGAELGEGRMKKARQPGGATLFKTQPCSKEEERKRTGMGVTGEVRVEE